VTALKSPVFLRNSACFPPFEKKLKKSFDSFPAVPHSVCTMKRRRIKHLAIAAFIAVAILAIGIAESVLNLTPNH
jgi:hypothetical protein